MRLYDAHNHLQDRRLEPHRQGMFAELVELGLRGAVVNGTREDDWGDVAKLAAEHRWIIPSFGLHPWYVATRSSRWLEVLATQLKANPDAVIGEIGLDRWIKGYDLEQQTDVFAAQLQLAVSCNVAVTIHCLKAWGALWEIIRSSPVPARGFLLHAYSGPAEMVAGFLERGAYFSFSTYFLHDRKEAQRELFRKLPPERLLVETDAPDMAPPPERSRGVIGDPETGKPLNHPVNLLSAYEEVAQIRGIAIDELAALVECNFIRLFRRLTGVVR